MAHGRLVGIAAELIETGAWQGHGVKSVEHWLGWHAGLSGHRARQITSIARCRVELPVTSAALDRGELSVDQVLPIVRHAPACNDTEVASLAKVTTVPQLTSTLSRYSFDDPSVDVADDASSPLDGRRRGTVVLRHDEGRFGLRVDAPSDDGALIEKALHEAKDALFQSGQAGVTWMDALRETCERSMSQVASTGRRDKFRIYLHLDTAAAGSSPPAAGWVNQGHAVPPSLLEKLCCDGIVQPVWHTDGLPVSVGRSQRIVPERTRRLVLDRDRGCVVPGCEATLHLEVHHLVAWSRGGRTDIANLACLCTLHHDALHRGELTISGYADRPRAHPDGLRFRDGLGRAMPPGPVPQMSRLDAAGMSPDRPGQRPASVSYKHPTGERLQQRWVHFTPASTATTASSSAQPHAPPA